MPTIPKWIGDTMENVLASKYMTIEVTKVDYLSPQVKKVFFKCDLTNVDYHPGYAVTFRVNETDFRHYTVSAFDRAAGSFEIVFHLHGNGPGSAFAAKLCGGDWIKMVTPRGKKMYRESPYHILFGDETSLGLCEALKQEFDQRLEWYSGIVELDLHNASVPGKMDLAIDVIDRNAYGKCLYMGDLLDKALGEKGAPRSAISYYLTGNATSIQLFRKMLKERGVKSSEIITQAYWAAGKAGM